MEIEGESLDDVLIKLYPSFLESSGHNENMRGGNVEKISVLLRIKKPRARLSRSENRGKAFSALGELLWYLGKTDDLEFIKPYVNAYKDDAVDGVLPGAYGPRIFSMRGIDQLEHVTRLLNERPSTRRAVIQLFNAEDISSLEEIPCTTTLQFFIRDKQLHLSVTMRSNDAYWGLPHDVFCFTMLQEMMARRLGCELGEYYHYVGSLHIYDKHFVSMKNYIAEGYQRDIEMPSMPEGDPFSLIPSLLKAEKDIRENSDIVASEIFSSQYWADILRLIQVFWKSRRNEPIEHLEKTFSNSVYRSYLENRRR